MARFRRMMQPCDTAPAQHAAHNRPRDREDFTEEGCKLNIGFIGAGKAGVSLGKYFAVRQQDALQNERGRTQLQQMPMRTVQQAQPQTAA